MSKENSLLRLKNVSKFYYSKGTISSGFNKVNLEFDLGEFVVITGESGSGKSTLLNVLSGLDSYEEGEMYINGEETSHYNENDFEHYRKTYIGNIFQSFNLIGSYTVYENIELVLLLNGYARKDVKEKVLELIKAVDLYKFRNTKASKLSGGQKQRVAIARALAKDTPIIIADEPTGNLDVQSANSIMALLANIAKNKLVIIVTHNYEQAEKYATRKIEMHDGKVREDIHLSGFETGSPDIGEYSDLRPLSKLRLSFRNTFNILPKFILMFVVFLFIIMAFLGEYASFRELEYEETRYGINYFFPNYNDTRIIINKENKSPISNDDFEKIREINNISRIYRDDILLDAHYNLQNDDYYLDGRLGSLNEIKEVDKGIMPEHENEAVIEGYCENYYLANEEDLFKQELNIYTDTMGLIGEEEAKIKIVGIKCSEDLLNNTIYVSSNILNEARIRTNHDNSTLTVKLNNNTFTPEAYDTYMNIIPNKNVPKNMAFIADSASMYCKNGDCNKKKISINAKNIYYEENLDLTISKVYTSKNFRSLTSLRSYEENQGYIFISYEGYDKLYNKDTYQASVYVSDVRKSSEVITKLQDLGYNTLALKDAKSSESDGVFAIVKIFKLIITIVLFIVLFYIAYFVIRLIQKSKNIYYATVRILGGSKKVIKSLIRSELYIIFNITYFLTIWAIVAVKYDIINIAYLKNLTTYLSLKDYILIYVLIFIMSYLISSRYSRKLFSSSAMKTYKEEV